MILDEINVKLANKVIELEKENRDLFELTFPELAQKYGPTSEGINSIIYIALKSREEDLLKRIEMKKELLNQKNNSRQAVT